ncbi:hypothetical protein PCNPT3_10955 [Psychromonas sp. CNPT3]|uniref:hypothetical protein n=1 Tax=Psychromonas sp. CNPT3 TaxID=314282 RepID=UPI00006E4280|nr:hypothetical protein [Psychromonas sp. CNPT3]AGH82127.1 hypothetical protein PCNPT3_10955 [Psychromonas sp. CNPT3]
MLINFRKNFNCCKTVGCANFGKTENVDYIQQSERLGYVSTGCELCGSHAPWINNELVNKVLKEKTLFHFGRKLTGCPKCHPYFFLTEPSPAKLHGFTSAGTQRKKCSQCNTVFSLQNYKKIAVLKRVLNSVLKHHDTKTAIKETQLSARLYYFYLDKLARILGNFSRIREQLNIQDKHLVIHSEGRSFKLEHHRGVYTLLSAEGDSGYILLQTNNMTQDHFDACFIYNETKDTMIKSIYSDNIENVLIDRYQQNLQRNHFEQLIIGDLRPITKCSLIYPDKVAYIHFQLLKGFTQKVESYTHIIEHESTLRAGALMACDADIRQKKAEVYFFVEYPKKAATHWALAGKGLGWWKDTWHSNELGAYSPITPALTKPSHLALLQSQSIERFYDYLEANMNKKINSMSVIDNVFEIHRVIYNYCELHHAKSAAFSFSLATKNYSAEELLDEALQVVMA